MKAQATTEYLIMFAVAIIIALIAVGVLGGFPDLSGGVGARDSAAYWNVATIGITKYIISTSSENSSIAFRNNNNFPIYLNSVTVANQTRPIGQALSPGQSIQVDGGSSISCPLPGAKYYYMVMINYTDVSTGNSYVFYGEKPLVGVCQAAG
jgi:hypothetical protein